MDYTLIYTGWLTSGYQVLALENEFKKRDAELIREFGDETPEVTADADQLKQVFLNIIQNFLQALDKTQKKIKI